MTLYKVIGDWFVYIVFYYNQDKSPSGNGNLNSRQTKTLAYLSPNILDYLTFRSFDHEPTLDI